MFDYLKYFSSVFFYYLYVLVNEMKHKDLNFKKEEVITSKSYVIEKHQLSLLSWQDG